MSRLGPVRAALDGHGGGLILAKSELRKCIPVRMLYLWSSIWTVLVFLRAAPGTLKGIQDDLLMDMKW